MPLVIGQVCLFVYLFMFSEACSITDYESDTVILTGGERDDTRASNVTERYGHSGLIETLPSLNVGRQGHGCSSYFKDGKQVILNV